MALAKVPENREVEFLNEFCLKSCMTFEGIDLTSKEGKKSVKDLETLLRATGYDKKEFVGFHFTGEVMNRNYSLTGDNAYPNDLVFLVIPDYYNPDVKKRTGARWFSDIVANNTIQQNAINFNQEPDYGGDTNDDDEEEEIGE